MEIAACGCLVSEALVKPLVVVEAEVSVQASPQFVSRFARVQVHVLLLHAAPQPLDEDVVQGTATAVHADGNAVVFQQLHIVCRGELAALVAVDDFWASVAPEGFPEHCNAPLCRHRVAQAPAHHVARVHVYDGEQVHVAATHRDVADVKLPDLVAVVYAKAFQQVRVLVCLLVGDRRAVFGEQCPPTD